MQFCFLLCLQVFTKLQVLCLMSALDLGKLAICQERVRRKEMGMMKKMIPTVKLKS